MAAHNFFPKRPAGNPMIYAYTDKAYPNLLKIGYTAIDVATRVAQQYPTLRPDAKPYTIVYADSAMRPDGSSFTDKAVHKVLRQQKIHNPNGEWFACSVRQVRAVVEALRNYETVDMQRTERFAMRPEQREAVDKTSAYFRNYTQTADGRIPHLLWNCKMRFGKTFAAYQLAKRMEWKRILVLTFKPAVQSAWADDLQTHCDFEGWQFISHDSSLTYETADHSRPIVCFGSFQDYLGKDSKGRIKVRNEWVHAINWDCVILDEYHYGAWRNRAKELFGKEAQLLLDFSQDEMSEPDEVDYFDEAAMPITTGAYLYLSGTPFRALNSGEFIEEQIYNWTYSDEQAAKRDWNDADGANPYAALPRMVMMTYQLPDNIQQVAQAGEFNEFDLNTFFEATGIGAQARFINENEVQQWLNLIRGAYKETIVSDLKLGTQRPPMPFSHTRLLNLLNHTVWFLPNVAACQAMANLLQARNNVFYHDYQIHVAAGTDAGVGLQALPPLYAKIGDEPLRTKSITLTCGKLLTGVSVRPWTGIFMLCNCASPETYFQAAFRVQTPWTMRNPNGTDPHRVEILKEECYIFDFAPTRALRQVADYSCRLNMKMDNPEKKVEEFISFLPVLAYDGSSMRQIDAAGILDMVTSGTSATLLARRWESALLVNVDNDTLRRLMNNHEAMKALMSIEGFRSLNQDLQTIINKSEAVTKARKEKGEKDMTDKEKKVLTAEEKEYKSLRTQIQKKLIKFATRIPIFLYLTDYRENCLRDVITKLEPDLFRKVTGLQVEDFELLVSLGVFNAELMNDAIYKFRRYEDASLEYTGINRHRGEHVGLFDTALAAGEYGEVLVELIE